MQLIDFNVGSLPWDNLQPPLLERDGEGALPGWTDDSTGVTFQIVRGRMFLGSMPNHPANRWLVFHRTLRQSRAVLSIRFPHPSTFIRFKLACDLVGPVEVRYYAHAPEGDLVEERFPPVSTVFADVEYNRICWPVEQVVIESADLRNSVDDVEFGWEEPAGWSRGVCQISRAARTVGKSLGGMFGQR